MYDAPVRRQWWQRLAVVMCLAGPAAAQPGEPADAPVLPRERVEVANPAFPRPLPEPPPVDRGRRLERSDLQPYFLEGPAAQARAAYDAGRYAEARALLEGMPDSEPVQFLRALSAQRAGDHAFAGAAFEGLAERYLALRDRCLVHAGWSREAAREWADAARVYAQVAPTARLYPDARLGLARARRHLKDLKGAHAVIADFVKRTPPPWGRNVGAEALLLEADLHAAKPDAAAERASLLAVWSRHPASKEAEKAEARLGDLTQAPPEALVARAEALIEVHRNAQGLALVEPMLPTLALPEPLACRAHFAAGKGYRKLRQHAKAVATLGPVARRCKDAELRARALYTLGFSQSIVAPASAPQTFEALAKGFAAHPLADDALFLAADVYARRGERAQARERLVDVVDGYPAGDHAADALFKLFWLARADGSLDEALEILRELEGRWAGAEDSYEVERARYWRARVLEAQEKAAEALAVYAATARAHPATYYGLLSRERVEAMDPALGARLLGEVAAAETAADPFPVHAGPLSGSPQLASAIELLRLGFGALVPTELLAIERAGLPPESVRLLVLLMSLSGEERAAHGMARLWLRRELSGPVTAERRALWEIAYPRAFRDLVVTHASAADELDPDLLQALMREESALDPKALSWAGALGLCQLMPATAAGVAMQLKLKRPTQAELLTPEPNIRLGARYLADLVIRMEGVKPFALASYNAGEAAVGRWRRENGDGDLAAWVEQIPLQETRGYVKRVLRSYNTYKLLYAPGEHARTVAPLAPKPPKRG